MPAAIKTLLFFLMLVPFFCGCTQKYGIVKTHSYVREITAGNIPVDQNNTPTSSGVRKNHIIYVETQSNSETTPEWQAAWVEGVSYNIEPIVIQKAAVHLGPLKNGTEEVVVKAKKGNQLWQLMLGKKMDLQPDSTLKALIQKNKIVITGKWKGSPFNYPIEAEQQLAKTFGE